MEKERRLLEPNAELMYGQKRSGQVSTGFAFKVDQKLLPSPCTQSPDALLSLSFDAEENRSPANVS